MTRTRDMVNQYYNILINLGIYADINEAQFNIIYKRYKKIGGHKDLNYLNVKRKLRRED